MASKEPTFDVEAYSVTIWRDKANGKIVGEEWFDADRLRHRDGAPALMRRDPVTDVVYREWWYQHGKGHREDEPAVINRDKETGKIKSTVWMLGGVRITPPKRSRQRPRSGSPSAQP